MMSLANMRKIVRGRSVTPFLSTVLCASLLVASGCGKIDTETVTGADTVDSTDAVAAADTASTPAAGADTATTPATTSGLDLSTVTFLHANPTNFPVNATVTSATVSGNHHINMSFTRPRYQAENGIDANVWVFGNVNGQWYAATFEWVRVGATGWNKDLEATGSQAPFVQTEASPLNSWRPVEGETVYFMVSSICRGGARSGARGRSEPFKATWHF